MTFSIVSWALIVEKAWQCRKVRRQTFEFLRVFRDARRPSIVHSAARKLRQSPLAQLYFAAYQEVAGIPEVLDKVLDDLDDGLSAERLEAVDPALRRAAAPARAAAAAPPPLPGAHAPRAPFHGAFRRGGGRRAPLPRGRRPGLGGPRGGGPRHFRGADRPGGRPRRGDPRRHRVQLLRQP